MSTKVLLLLLFVSSLFGQREKTPVEVWVTNFNSSSPLRQQFPSLSNNPPSVSVMSLVEGKTVACKVELWYLVNNTWQYTASYVEPQDGVTGSKVCYAWWQGIDASDVKVAVKELGVERSYVK